MSESLTPLETQEKTVPEVGVTSSSGRKIGPVNITVDVDAQLAAVENPVDEHALRSALDQLAAHAELADIDEVAEVITNQLSAYRTGIRCPHEHLKVLLCRQKPLGASTIKAVRPFFHHGDPGVRGIAVHVLGKHGGDDPEIRDDVAGAMIDSDWRVIVCALRGLGDANSDPPQNIEDLLRALMHAWVYFKDRSEQDQIRAVAHEGIERQLQRVEGPLPQDLERRLRSELNLGRRCHLTFVALPARRAYELLLAKISCEKVSGGSTPDSKAPAEEAPPA